VNGSLGGRYSRSEPQGGVVGRRKDVVSFRASGKTPALRKMIVTGSRLSPNQKEIPEIRLMTLEGAGQGVKEEWACGGGISCISQKLK